MLLATYVIVSLILLLCGILVVLIIYLRHDNLNLTHTNSFVSILVAARNEEENILSCLKALGELNYSNYEVWIGNDGSTDKTQELIEAFIKDKPNFNILNITQNLGEAKGKSNVLAQLVHKAKGDFFFITDADIQVPNNWIDYMLSSFYEGVGVVSGFTVTGGTNLFAKMQRIDWAYAMGMVKVVSDFGKPIVGIGNNMAVTREAYFSTGGYENLPFSVVEDYQLFTEITSNGYGFRNLLHFEVKAESKPLSSFKSLLEQRKRWMFGAFQLPISVLSILVLQAIYYVLALIICFIKPSLGLNLIVFKSFIQAVFVKSVFAKIGERVSFFYMVLFEFYQLFLSTASLIYYYFPSKIKWKGRTY